MKVPLEHFLQYLEKEERVHRAVGGLTTALGSVIKALDYDLSMLVRTQKAKRRTARAVKDAKLVEECDGSDILGEMVLKSMQGLRYIHEHEDGVLHKVGATIIKPMPQCDHLSQLLSWQVWWEGPYLQGRYGAAVGQRGSG